MAALEIGNVQAWRYPMAITMLWECFLERHFRDHELPEDPNMQGL